MNSIFCGIEKVSLVDFDGYVACTLFAGGCNYKCPFCHNSPLIKHQPTISMDEIFDYLNKRKKMIDAVVITGGEPTLHHELPDIIREIKNLGFIIKLDTNGTNPIMLKELIDNRLIDYVAMDVKTSINNYHIVTGTNNPLINNIEKSINILKTSKIEYELRTTLVKEYHDFDTINEMKVFLNGTKKLFLQKFVLRDSCIDQNLNEVDYTTAHEYKKILEEVVENVYLRGY